MTCKWRKLTRSLLSAIIIKVEQVFAKIVYKYYISLGSLGYIINSYVTVGTFFKK